MRDILDIVTVSTVSPRFLSKWVCLCQSNKVTVLFWVWSLEEADNKLWRIFCVHTTNLACPQKGGREKKKSVCSQWVVCIILKHVSIFNREAIFIAWLSLVLRFKREESAAPWAWTEMKNCPLWLVHLNDFSLIASKVSVHLPFKQLNVIVLHRPWISTLIYCT